MSEPRLTKRKGKTLLVAPCCPHPHGELKGGKLHMKSPHERRAAHPVEFTPAKLREIADRLEEEATSGV